jgi:hypothetical protein
LRLEQGDRRGLLVRAGALLKSYACDLRPTVLTGCGRAVFTGE